MLQKVNTIQMDIKNNFTISFNQLRKNKVIIIPILISLIIPLILFSIYFYVSGLSDVTYDLAELHNEYKEQEPLGYIAGTNEFYKGFVRYANEKGFDWTRFTDLITTENIILLIIFILITFIFSIYLSCAVFSMISLNIKKRSLDFSNTFGQTNRLLFRYIFLRILISLIFGVPLSLAVVISILSFFISPILGGILIFFFIILIIAYLIIMGLRLFFVTPLMFIEHRSASTSIKNCFKITKGRLKHVFFIFAIIYGITLFTNSIANSPLSGSIGNLIMTDNIFTSIIVFFIMIFFIILKALMLTFVHMFLFYSYIDFKTK